ncbi:TetR/AcrR family transcriptional regulator [Acuticoccus sp. M5D2P5]|uniref:TetR/AcrR family transcriptional regulator n=1 Tax=Acuticoccus kalidii TaxID=2910977 RepID=UPI001F42E459|nr:TetR/AcrR family transcriptional regulator [Acuticoccus kalidii]MCF3932751.1 TetR/AcrR family transcriptional regulator [Acuticoccus kalidii]
MTQPTPSSSLNARRRRRTARDIQNATLGLALAHGFGHVTTGMIADAAGVSLRTFFNYFPNKEAALAGEPLRFKNFDFSWFRASRQPLLPDLERLLGEIVADAGIDRERLCRIEELCRTDTNLQAVFANSLQGLVDQLADLLVARMGEDARQTAELVAALVGRALANAYRASVHDDEPTSDVVVRLTIRQIHAVGALLHPVDGDERG